MKQSRIRELYEQYIGGMAQWQIKLAIARMLNFRVPPDAWQNTMQELAIVVHTFTFDPKQAGAASEETILCRLFDNRIRMLARTNARRQATLKRLGQLGQPEADTNTPCDTAAQSEVLRVVAGFSPLDQRICHGLMNGLSALQIATLTGRHYTTIARHIQRIGEIFADRGYDPWSA